MAKIKTRTLSFPASGSPDVVGYKLYYEEAPTPVGYNSLFVDLGGSTSVDLDALAEFAGVDGIYNLGVSAVDDVGNESDMSIASDVPLDFLPPDPPGAISIT